MKRLTLFVLLYAVRTWATSLVAGMDVTAEFLYLRPQLCDLGFVIDDRRAHGNPMTTESSRIDRFLPSGDTMCVCPDPTAAFRVGVAYLLCGGSRDLHFGYTGIWSCDVRSKESGGDGGLWPTTGHPRYNNLRLNGASIAQNVPNALLDGADPVATARQQVHIEHNRVDAAWAWRRWNTCRLWTRASLGVRWADICIRQTADYAGVVTFVGPSNGQEPTRIVANQLSHSYMKTEVWGIGPLIEASLRYLICGNFGLRAHGAASLLVGQYSQHLNAFVLRGSLVLDIDPNNDVDEMLNLSTASCTGFVPEIDARLGISYGICCGARYSLLVELGWEFTAYIHGIGRLRFNDVAGTNRETCESFNLDGLYLSICIRI